jgi:hypothetical protein
MELSMLLYITPILIGCVLFVVFLYAYISEKKTKRKIDYLEAYLKENFPEKRVKRNYEN